MLMNPYLIANKLLSDRYLQIIRGSGIKGIWDIDLLDIEGKKLNRNCEHPLMRPETVLHGLVVTWDSELDGVVEGWLCEQQERENHRQYFLGENVDLGFFYDQSFVSAGASEQYGSDAKSGWDDTPDFGVLLNLFFTAHILPEILRQVMNIFNSILIDIRFYAQATPACDKSASDP